MFPELGRSLFERFEEEGIPLLLAGGWAIGHYGHQRFTRDLDWVCSRSHEEKVKELMTSMGFAVEFESMATRFTFPRDPAVLPVDFIWVDDASFRKMGQNSEKTTNRRDIPVVDFAALLAMKINAFKNGEERGHRDLLDVRMILSYNPGVITEETLRALCERYGGPDAYNQIRNLK